MSSLKLFRSTGYSSMFTVGESRVTLHPGWVVAATSLWIGFACNVKLWRELGSGGGGPWGLIDAIALGAFVAADCAIVLSVLGWHKTLKPAATLLLCIAALSAATIWGQALPFDATLADRKLSSLILPPWTSLLHWQVPVLVAALGLVPIVWLWHARVRRLPGPQQLNINVIGTLVACAVLAVSAFLLSRGFA